MGIVVKGRWRSERDSNPRYGFCPYNALAGRPLRPLGHHSGELRFYSRAALRGHKSAAPSDPASREAANTPISWRQRNPHPPRKCPAGDEQRHREADTGQRAGTHHLPPAIGLGFHGETGPHRNGGRHHHAGRLAQDESQHDCGDKPLVFPNNDPPDRRTPALASANSGSTSIARPRLHRPQQLASRGDSMRSWIRSMACSAGCRRPMPQDLLA